MYRIVGAGMCEQNCNVEDKLRRVPVLPGKESRCNPRVGWGCAG